MAVLSRGTRTHHALFVINVILELITEVLDETGDGHCGCITQRADCAPLNFGGNVVEQINIFRTTFAVFNTMEYTRQTPCTFSTRRALATGLLVVEVGDTL